MHLIGVGGAGMRNLARLFLADGLEVTGSDMKDSKGLRELRSLGADVWVGHDPARLASPDVVIVSSAIGGVQRRAGGRAGAGDRGVGAAAGAGGAGVLVAGPSRSPARTARRPPPRWWPSCWSAPGSTPAISWAATSTRAAAARARAMGDLFVFEADESDGSFLLASPSIGVITNVDVDHVDFYPGGRDEIERAFAAFAARCGHVVACGDDAGVRRALELAGCRARPPTGSGRTTI